jgi:hypothetical protein
MEPAVHASAATATEEQVYVPWDPEIASGGWRERLPEPTIDAEWYIETALDGLTDEPYGEVRYTARDGRRVRILKGHPPTPGQRRLF